MLSLLPVLHIPDWLVPDVIQIFSIKEQNQSDNEPLVCVLIEIPNINLLLASWKSFTIQSTNWKICLLECLQKSFISNLVNVVILHIITLLIVSVASAGDLFFIFSSSLTNVSVPYVLQVFGSYNCTWVFVFVWCEFEAVTLVFVSGYLQCPPAVSAMSTELLVDLTDEPASAQLGQLKLATIEDQQWPADESALSKSGKRFTTSLITTITLVCLALITKQLI